jgi:NAD(P)H-hydrate epimerase
VVQIFKIKRRQRHTHKGDYGHLLVIAGSLGMTGAAYLCCEAAILSGAGLVTLAIPKGLSFIMARKLTEAMSLPLPETKDVTLSKKARRKILKFAKKRCNCVAIGCGLSRNKETQDLIRSLIRDLKLPLVVDADGLNALSGHLSILRTTNDQRPTTILTPHLGEMARLIDKKISFIEKNKKTIARDFSIEYNVTTVLKGYRTVVASPDGRVYINDSGNPGMASGGCGDVLTGIIAAFLAQGMDGFKAARLGTYLHGLAGDLAAREKTEISLRATDLLKFLPQAFKRVYK